MRDRARDQVFRHGVQRLGWGGVDDLRLPGRLQLLGERRGNLVHDKATDDAFRQGAQRLGWGGVGEVSLVATLLPRGRGEGTSSTRGQGLARSAKASN